MTESEPRLRTWLPGVIVTLLVISGTVWLNWWRVSFREPRVLGLNESELVARFGIPDIDSSRPLHSQPRPMTEQERIELGADPISDYEMIWYTGLGGTHARVRMVDGAAISVEYGSHR